MLGSVLPSSVQCCTQIVSLHHYNSTVESTPLLILIGMKDRGAERMASIRISYNKQVVVIRFEL